MSGPGEFELIARFFERPGAPGRAPLGIGDDCALLAPGAEGAFAVSTDMLVEGRHFFSDVDPAALGHKALAVNLSDLAAMGARPVGFTLALALPAVDERWLAAFAAGMFGLADAHGCELVGGDTTRGPLNVCITVFGSVPPDAALRRDRARPGDEVWVSGELGAAAWAVACRQAPDDTEAPDAPGASGMPDAPAAALERLDRPQPRVDLGLALRGVAGAAIDLSDGLAGDIGHVLARSTRLHGAALGATLDWPDVPVHPVLDGLPEARRVALALCGGDDYELLFTARPDRRADITAIGRALGLKLTRIGRIDAEPGLRLLAADARPMRIHARGFDHFR
jgi:thiamine-monophosphate kinase